MRVGLEDRAQDRRVRLRVADRPRPRHRGSRDDRAPRSAPSCRSAASASSCSRPRSGSTAAKNPVYWIYGYKRGAFWPFVPTGERAGARQRRGARAEGEAREGAADRAGPDPLVRAVRRAALAGAAAAVAALAVASTVSLGSGGIRRRVVPFQRAPRHGPLRRPSAARLRRQLHGATRRVLPARPARVAARLPRDLVPGARAGAAEPGARSSSRPQGVRDGDNDPGVPRLAAPGRNWETALARELPQVVDARYRRSPTRRGRALIGVSAGGYGAMLLGLHDLGTFGRDRVVERLLPSDRPHRLARARPPLRRPATRTPARTRRLPRLRRAVRLRNRPSSASTSARRTHRFRAENVQLHRELGAARVPHVFRVYPGGHGQRLWAAQARTWLALALAHLQPPRG